MESAARREHVSKAVRFIIYQDGRFMHYQDGRSRARTAVGGRRGAGPGAHAAIMLYGPCGLWLVRSISKAFSLLSERMTIDVVDVRDENFTLLTFIYISLFTPVFAIASRVCDMRCGPGAGHFRQTLSGTSPGLTGAAQLPGLTTPAGVCEGWVCLVHWRITTFGNRPTA